MANNVQFESSSPSTPSSATIVETIDTGGGVQRQVIRIGDAPGLAIAISSGTVTPSSAVSVTPSSAIQVAFVGVPTVTISSGTVTLSSNATVTLSSNPTVIPSSVVTVTPSSNPTVILSSNPTITSVSSGLMAIANGANTAAVKPAGTAASSSDPALVVAISPNNPLTIAITSATVTLSSNPTVIPSSAFNVTVASGTITLSSNPTVIPSSVVSVALSSVATVTLSSNVTIGSGTITLSSNPTVIPSSAFQVTPSSAVTITPSSALTVTPSSNLTVTQNQLQWYAGTAASTLNGLFVAQITILASEFNSLVSSGTAQSLTNGNSSGIFTSSMTGQAVWGDIWLTIGGSLASISAGSNVAGWWQTSPDGGTTFENYTSSVVGQPRSPDWIIPMSSGVVNAGTVFKSAGPILVPALQFRVIAQNNTGVTWSTSNVFKLATYGNIG